MPTLTSLVVPVFPPEIAPDRALQGDQYDIKIDNLRADLLAVTTALDAGVGTPSSPIGAAGGDLRGTYPDPIVRKIQTVPVVTTTPLDMQILTYDGVTEHAWVPTSPMMISANAGNIQDVPVAVTAPGDGQALVYNGLSYVPASFPLAKENTLPPPASTTDYFSGSAGATAFTNAGNTSSFVTISNTAVSRGGTWTSAGTVRFDSTSRPGWILMQPSPDDGANSLIWTYGLTGGSPANAAFWFVNSFDDFAGKTDIASLVFVFSQSNMGGPDTDNLYAVQVISTATANQWTITSFVKEGGAITNLSTETITSAIYPCPIICMERHSAYLRAWTGLNKNSLKQLAADHSSAITPDRLSIQIFTKGRPNTVFGINQILKTTSALL